MITNGFLLIYFLIISVNIFVTSNMRPDKHITDIVQCRMFALNTVDLSSIPGTLYRLSSMPEVILEFIAKSNH